MTQRPTSFVARLLCDERGGAVMEHALVAGLLVIAAIVVVATVGAKLLATRSHAANDGL